MTQEIGEFLEKLNTLCWEYKIEIKPTHPIPNDEHPTISIINGDEVVKLLYIDGDGNGKQPLNQNKMTKHKKVIWECLSCGNQHESYSNRRWDMQVCECGKSGLDLEEFYSRTMGEIRIIKEEELEK